MLRRPVAIFGVLLSFGASAAHAVPAAQKSAKKKVTLDSLLGAFASMPGLEADFIEQKTLSLLAKPLVSRGKLYFAHPGLMHRRISSPRPSSIVLTPSAVRIVANGKTQLIDLARLKDVGALVQSLVWLLAGKKTALAKVYNMTLSHAADGWTLRLLPKGPPLTKLLDAIEIRGRGRRVETVRVKESSGDEILTRIENANPKRRFSAQEKKQLFGLSSAK
jgi:outer membrane lipoprotein-sorting protein